MQTKPTLTSQRVWSATDFHTVEPTSATWATGVITFISPNHSIGNGDSVTIVCADTTNAWNIGAVIATVVDKDTFTVPLVGDPGQYPNTSPYPVLNNQAHVVVQCFKYSKIFYLIDVLHVDVLGSGSTIQLQAKVHDDAAWINVGSAVAAAGLSTVVPYNYMRVTFASGSTVSTVYAQRTK